ncbi:SRPBCC family protein [Sciscionella marina]|uniref:SRPBCC family protein n=1 Tax=Sciscionella marina TaxID=508770 RepID=UPI00036E39A7|nr:SRPBCC family protein [Sciscionella marina]
MPEGSLEATRAVAASAHRIFAFLARPAEHRRIDTSGMVRGSVRDGRVTAVGEGFVMDMDNPVTGAHRVENHGVTFEPDRAIGWAPATPGHPPAGHTWTWRLAPLDAGSTRVTLTYDWSAFRDRAMLDRLPVLDRGGWHALIDRLAEIYE